MRRNFLNWMRESKGTTFEVISLLCRPVHYWLELAVSIQQHQGFLRHRNEAVQALQRDFGQQDDGFLMILSKQFESTKIGLSAPHERERQKNGGEAGPPMSVDHFKHW